METSIDSINQTLFTWLEELRIVNATPNEPGNDTNQKQILKCEFRHV